MVLFYWTAENKDIWKYCKIDAKIGPIVAKITIFAFQNGQKTAKIQLGYVQSIGPNFRKNKFLTCTDRAR